jgi:FeS assembly SUF system protein
MNAPDRAAPPVDADALRERIIDVLRTVFDPEIPVNIYELGLVYDVQVNAEGDVAVEMTLTTPNCPAAGFIPGDVESKIRMVEGVRAVTVDLVFDPPWTQDRMSEAARLELGFM